jgi:hypothetical protein
MALGKCPECAGSVSTTAKVCPHCGNTKFEGATGRRIKVGCKYCSATGSRTHGDPETGFSTYTCDQCKGSGQLELVEFKDLRDNSPRPWRPDDS